MVKELPEQLIAQAEFLVRKSDSDEASIRRSVSTAYYALYHLLVRDAVSNWKHADYQSRLARTFEHKQMKSASTAILEKMRTAQEAKAAESDGGVRFKLSTVAQAFVDLQQARHKADYDISGPFNPLDAVIDVAQVRLAFLNWAEIRDTTLAQGYLYSLLFKDRS